MVNIVTPDQIRELREALYNLSDVPFPGIHGDIRRSLYTTEGLTEGTYDEICIYRDRFIVIKRPVGCEMRAVELVHRDAVRWLLDHNQCTWLVLPPDPMEGREWDKGTRFIGSEWVDIYTAKEMQTLRKHPELLFLAKLGAIDRMNEDGKLLLPRHEDVFQQWKKKHVEMLTDETNPLFWKSLVCEEVNNEHYAYGGPSTYTAVTALCRSPHKTEIDNDGRCVFYITESRLFLGPGTMQIVIDKAREAAI